MSEQGGTARYRLLDTVRQYALERLRVRLPGAFIPLYFCVVNLAPLLALAWLARGDKKVVWETGR